MKRIAWALVAAGVAGAWLTHRPALPTAPAPALFQAAQPVAAGGLASEQSPQASYNWAGLVQANGAETSVSASWTVPQGFAAPAPPGSAVGEWVGLGGVNSSDLIQVGTITQPDVNGQAATWAFWEVLPFDATVVAQVPAGTTVTASITPSGTDTWTLSLTEAGSDTPLVSQTVILSPSQAQGVETSADWITERISTSFGGLMPLAPFGSVTMQNLEANGSPPSGNLTLTELVNSADIPLAVPTFDAASDTLTVSQVGSSTPGAPNPGGPSGVSVPGNPAPPNNPGRWHRGRWRRESWRTVVVFSWWW